MANNPDRKPDKEIEDRRDAGIAKMLNSPPKPHKDMKQGKAKSSTTPDKKRKPKS